MALLDQRHAVFAARDQHRLGAERTAEIARRSGDFFIGLGGATGCFGKLLPVRRDQRRALVDAVVAAFRIDQNRLAELIGGVDDGTHHARRERAFGVVGQHHRASARHRLDGMADERVFACRIDWRRNLPIGA